MFKEILPSEPRKWLSESQDEVGIFILRSMFALLWLTQAGIKIVDRSNEPNMDFHGFLGDLIHMEESNPLGPVSYILRKFLIPYHDILIWLVLATELTIAMTLGLGLFTRLGSFIGILMSGMLWILTLGWGEWFWTYPLLLVPHVLFFLARSGRNIGIDKMLVNRYENSILERIT